jgi:hypothetical protein
MKPSLSKQTPLEELLNDRQEQRKREVTVSTIIQSMLPTDVTRPLEPCIHPLDRGVGRPFQQ